MKNSQLAGSQDDRAGTARMRRWSEEKLSVRLFLVAFVLVLTGALVWDGWFASAIQNATWTPVLVSIAVVGAVAPGGGGLGCHDLVDGIGRPAAGLAAASPRDRGGGGRGGRGRCVRRWFRLPVRTR